MEKGLCGDRIGVLGVLAGDVQITGGYRKKMQKLELPKGRSARSLGLTPRALQMAVERLRVGEHHARKTEGAALFFRSPPGHRRAEWSGSTGRPTLGGWTAPKPAGNERS
jgi:hypothetical protein